MVDLASDAFQKLDARDAYVRLEGLHVAEDEEGDEVHKLASETICLTAIPHGGERKLAIGAR